jgi:DNA-binding CsgD family transcriptional regulator
VSEEGWAPVDQELIDRIYHAVVAPETWRGIVRDICRAFDAHSGALVLTDNDTVLSAISVAHGVFEDSAVVQAYFSYFKVIDGAVPLFAGTPTGKIVSTGAVWSSRELARDEFYNDFFLKLGLVDSIGGNLVRDDRGTAMFTMQRAPIPGNFAPDDCLAVERLVPHLKRALQLHRVLAPSRRAAAAFVDVLEHVSYGVFTIDQTGRVWHRNRTAREIVDRCDGLMLSRDGQLTAVDRTAAGQIARLVGAVLVADRAHPGGTIKVPRAEGKPSYGLSVVPMPVATVSMFGVAAPERGALVLISDPDRARPDDIETAMAPYKLTMAEKRLVGALVAGRSLREHCEERGISINTGKFHLKSLFSKTGARSQADLVRIALSATGGR